LHFYGVPNKPSFHPIDGAAIATNIHWHQPTATLQLGASSILRSAKYTRRLRSLTGRGFLGYRHSSPLSASQRQHTHFTQMHFWDHQHRTRKLLAALGYQPRTSTSLSLPSGLTEFTARCMVSDTTLESAEDFLMNSAVTPFEDNVSHDFNLSVR